jgi:hypothetical protein
MCVYMYVCVYLCIYACSVYVCVCIFIHVYMYVCTRMRNAEYIKRFVFNLLAEACTYRWMFFFSVCMHACTHVLLYVCMYVCMYSGKGWSIPHECDYINIHTYTYTHTVGKAQGVHTHTYIHTHTHTHTVGKVQGVLSRWTRKLWYKNATWKIRQLVRPSRGSLRWLFCEKSAGMHACTWYMCTCVCVCVDWIRT